MWEDIILSISSAVGEAICTNWIDKRKRAKLNNRIDNIVVERMNSFADTSLDCNDFYKLVRSRNFIEIIKNYFCSIRDGLSNEEYINCIEDYIYQECPTVNHIEVREFVKKIKVLYEDYLHKMILDFPELNVVFQLMTVSHRDIVSKISESEENVKKYFSWCKIR